MKTIKDWDTEREHKDRQKQLSVMQQVAKTQIAMKRSFEFLTQIKAGKTLQDIASKEGLTRERIRQLIVKYNRNEYEAWREIHPQAKRSNLLPPITKKCAFDGCAKEFTVPRFKKAKLYCSHQCYRTATTKNRDDYPDWVGGRTIVKRNFTDEEWRVINRIRTRNYFRRNREKMNAKARLWYKRNRAKQAIYFKRHIERQKYGHAITPLKNPTNLKAIKP